jgi:serine/threonine-protein kinase HipA
MATQAGIIMAPCRLFHENGRAHFMTKRFDREVVAGNTVRHHIQSLCAMGELDFRMWDAHAYAQLFMIIADLGLQDGATEQAFLRMAFNVMAHNCDDHTKNFSFRLRKGNAWELAPAYDLTHPYNPSGRWSHQQLMSVNGKFEQITRQDLLQEADRFGVRRPLDLLANVRAVLDNWPQYAEEAALPAEIATRIGADFRPL